MSRIVTNAWTFSKKKTLESRNKFFPVNDSLATNLCLLWEPEVIAIALLYMSFKMARMADDDSDHDQAKMGTDHDWWDMVGYALIGQANLIPLYSMFKTLQCK